MESAEYAKLREYEDWYWWYRAQREHVVRAVERLRLPPGARVLDAGCGTGRNLIELTRRCSITAYGFDVAPEAAATWNGEVGVYRCRASVNDLPYADSSFDAVISVDVLGCRGVDARRSLGELRRVLRPGGALVLVVPAYQWLHSAHDRAVHSVVRFTRWRLRRMAHETGFGVDTASHCFPLFFPAIAGVRLFQNFGTKRASVARSDLRPLPTWVNRTLWWIARAERLVTARVGAPFGSTILMVARAPELTVAKTADVRHMTFHAGRMPAAPEAARMAAVPATRSWEFFGGAGSMPDRVYDWLRRGVNARLVRFLAQHLPTGRSVRVLEAGSGTAVASSLLARQPGVRMSVCVDIDEAALREARRRDPTISAVVGDLNCLPFADDAFGLVYNSSTVEHLPLPEWAVREMHRVCQPDGRVFVGVPYRFGPLWFQPIIRNTRLGVWLGPVFSRTELDRMMRRAALRPMTHLRYFWSFFVGTVAQRTDHS